MRFLSFFFLFIIFLISCKKNKNSEDNFETCNDGIKNGDEVFTDCGGSCKYCYNINFEIVENFNKTNSTLPDNDIDQIIIDKEGNIWLRIYGKGILKKTSNNWILYNDSVFSNVYLNQIYCSKDSSIWVSNQCYLYQYKNGIWKQYYYSDYGFSCISALGINETSEGKLLFSGKDKIIQYYNNIFSVYNTGLFGSQGSFSNSTVMETDDKLWIGTLDGIIMFYDGYTTILDTNNSALKSEYIYGLAINSNNEIYGGNNEGIFSFGNGKTLEYIEMDSTSNYNYEIVKYIAENDLFILNPSRIMIDEKIIYMTFNDGESYNINDVIYHNGYYWFATSNNGLLKAKIL